MSALGSRRYRSIRLGDTTSTMTRVDTRSVGPALNRKGFAHIRGLLSETEVFAARKVMDALVRDGGCPEASRDLERGASGAHGVLRKLKNPHLLDSLFMGFATDPLVESLLVSALGEPPQIFCSMAWLKPAYSGSSKPYHQDAAYWHALVNPADFIILWIALDDADEENGCMRYVPKSHRLGLREHVMDGQLLIPSTPDLEEAEELVPADAGDAILHDGKVIHRSLQNRSARQRRAVSIAFHRKSARVLVSVPNSSAADRSGR